MKRIRELRGWCFLSFMILMATGASFSFAQTNTFPPDGNVGIGTTGPTSQLTLHGSSNMVMLSVNANSLVLNTVAGIGFSTNPTLAREKAAIGFINTQGTAHGVGDLIFALSNTPGGATQVSAGDEKMRITKEGNVGIGTTVPGAKLDIRDADTVGAYMDNLKLGNGGSTFSYKFRHFGGSLPSTDRLELTDHGNSTIMTWRPDGNVGIGTITPTALLHVAGNAQVDGNIAAKYQDVAEWVKAPSFLAPATLVVIDPLENNQVLPASQAYDTRVAGVVSSQPGIILGEAGDDKVKVAHSGRVKVKADAQYGPIAVGDLLVSSATSGYAMRSTPVDINGISMHRPGTIIGKALEPLKDGQGEILVLLTLQ